MMTAESESLLLSLAKKFCFFLFFLCLPLQAASAEHSGKNNVTFAEFSVAPKSSYTVGPDDVLSIDVYDNPDLKGQYTVSTGGDIVFPLLGQLQVADMTVSAIKDHITDLLEKDYLYDPIVSVVVAEYRSKKVKIMGNIGSPGIYPLESPTRLFDLLTKAEGLSSQLRDVKSGQKAHIIRNSPRHGAKEKEKISNIYVDLYQLLVEGRNEANIYLQSGDVIYIPDTKYFHVVGEVKKTGSFPYEQGVTVLKAISLAGGATERASTKNTVIKRLRHGNLLEIDADMDTLLEPDDIVEVPLSFW